MFVRTRASLLNLLVGVCGLNYADVIADALSHDVLGVPIPIASAATLIRTKNTYRPQDTIVLLEREEPAAGIMTVR